MFICFVYSRSSTRGVAFAYFLTTRSIFICGLRQTHVNVIARFLPVYYCLRSRLLFVVLFLPAVYVNHKHVCFCAVDYSSTLIADLVPCGNFVSVRRKSSECGRAVGGGVLAGCDGCSRLHLPL